MTKQATKDMILNLIHELGRFPKIKELSDKMDSNVYQTQLMLKALVKDGFLVMQGNWYRLAPDARKKHVVSGRVSAPVVPEVVPTIVKPEPIKTPVIIPPVVLETAVSVETVEPEKVEKREPEKVEEREPQGIPQEEKLKEKPDIVISVLRSSMGFIGVGATLISLYYTYVWMSAQLPSGFAFLLSAIMVTFSVLAFEVVLLFVSKEVTDKWWRWLIALGFTILWLIVISFSIMSTIAGQYNQNVIKTQMAEDQYIDLNANRIEWNIIQETIKNTNVDLQAKRKSLAQFVSMADSVSKTYKEDKIYRRIWDNAQWNITKINKSIDRLNADLIDQRTKEKDLLRAQPEAAIEGDTTGKTNDFYGWIAGVWNWKRESIQFWMSLFPAVFVDIIAPAALAIALFLRRRRKRIEKEVKAID